MTFVSTLSRIQGVLGSRSIDHVSKNNLHNKTIVGPVINKVSFKKTRIELQREKLEQSNNQYNNDNKQELFGTKKNIPVTLKKFSVKTISNNSEIDTKTTSQKVKHSATIARPKGILRLKIKNNKIKKIVQSKSSVNKNEIKNNQVTSHKCVIENDLDAHLTVDEGMTVTCPNNDRLPEKVVTTRWSIPDSFSSSLDDSKLNLNYNKKHDLKYGKKPSIAKLAARRGFGRPSKNHSFTTDTTFDHVLLHLYKSEYLDKETIKNVSSVHPLYEHLHKTISRVINVDFTNISKPDYKYREQTDVTNESVQQFLSAAVYYDFHLGSIMRYAGNNYTASYLNVEQIIARLKGIVPTVTLDFLEKLLTLGAPVKINGHSTKENFKVYKDYGNHLSVLLKPELIRKALVKESKYKYVMSFPSWIARFIPNLHLTPQGILIREGKKDRIIFDGSIKLKFDSIPINAHMNAKNEPEIHYGKKFMMHLVRIWNLRITYKNIDIYLWDDDIAGAFRQLKYNPEIAQAFSFIIFQRLWMPCGQVFGSNTSPADFEALANAREYLAEHLSQPNYEYLIEKHKDILNKVVYACGKDESEEFVQAVSDSINIGVMDNGTGKPKNTEHNCFVDDNHMADIKSRITQAMAASIESLFSILGFPNEVLTRTPLSEDKYYEQKCSWRKIQLGMVVDTRKMMVELSPRKREKLITELRHWHSGRRSFTVGQAVKLLEKKGVCRNSCPMDSIHVYKYKRQHVNCFTNESFSSIR